MKITLNEQVRYSLNGYEVITLEAGENEITEAESVIINRSFPNAIMKDAEKTAPTKPQAKTRKKAAK